MATKIIQVSDEKLINAGAATKQHYFSQALECFENFYYSRVKSVEVGENILNIEMLINYTDTPSIVDRVDVTVSFNLKNNKYAVKTSGKGARKNNATIKYNVELIMNVCFENATIAYSGDVAEAIDQTNEYYCHNLKQLDIEKTEFTKHANELYVQIRNKMLSVNEIESFFNEMIEEINKNKQSKLINNTCNNDNEHGIINVTNKTNDLNSQKEINQMKKLTLKSVVATLKKFVSKKSSRPVLENAHVTENSIIATDAHQLIKIDREIVENEFFVEETSLYNPKAGEYSQEELNFPNVDRIIPQQSNEALTVTSENIKRMLEVIKFARAKSEMKKSTLLHITTLNNELVVGHNNVNGVYSNYYTTGIKSEINVEITLNAEYLNNALQACKKVLTAIKENEVKLTFISSLRPILINTNNNELQVVVLPVRVDKSINRNVVLSDNQEVTIEKPVKTEETKKATTKAVIFNSGIKNKKVVEYKQVNDYMSYVLKEDVKNSEDVEGGITFYAEINGHLFPIGRVDQLEKAKLYTSTDIVKMFKERYLEALEAGRKVSEGIKEYFTMNEEIETIETIEVFESESYKIELSESIDKLAPANRNDAKVYKLKAFDIKTGKLDQTKFATFEDGEYYSIIYLTKETALKEIELFIT